MELNDNNIGRDASELLRKVEAAQFVASHDGEVCPAKWKKGESTLKPSIDLVGKIDRFLIMVIMGGPVTGDAAGLSFKKMKGKKIC